MREQVIEATVQAAPMILIDGAWVQNAGNASTSHSQVGSKLFHIYVDEVGNGEVKLNHRNVHRELLAQMQVELPEFGTLEFSRWPGFRPQAFQVPVFWLCISPSEKLWTALSPAPPALTLPDSVDVDAFALRVRRALFDPVSPSILSPRRRQDNHHAAVS